MSIESEIRKINCCACGGSLKDSKHINGICLNKKAAWVFPVWGNVLVKDSHGRATAFVCDQCLENKATPKFAVEFRKDGGAIYHPVEDLESVRPNRGRGS